MGHKIQSKKAPFANLANLIYERELIKILALYYPIVNGSGSASHTPDLLLKGSLKFMQEHRLPKKVNASVIGQDILDELHAVASYLTFNPLGEGVSVRWWGKFKLLNGCVLGSCLSALKAQSAHQSEWFEALNITSSSNFNDPQLTFGEALAFYEVKTLAVSHAMVVYWELKELESSLNVPRRVWNCQILKVENVVNILNIVGIWMASEASKRTYYILRKHPGLAMSSMAESGIDGEIAADKDED